jgi:hypothetical protein
MDSMEDVQAPKKFMRGAPTHWLNECVRRMGQLDERPHVLRGFLTPLGVAVP